jgi:hypothetical protein
VLENPEFLRFAAHWGFRIRACRPYRAQTKGKVERPIRYVRQSFLYGRAFAGDADLNAQALGWLDQVANPRVHGTTGDVPRERFEREERAVLGPLAARPYHSLVLLPEPAPVLPSGPGRPRVLVERRPLTAYAALAGAGG